MVMTFSKRKDPDCIFTDIEVMESEIF